MSFIASIYAPNNHPGTFRLGIIAGFILYSAFGILDYYMLPSTYIFAWKVRFLIVGPSMIIPLYLSYFPKFHRYLNILTHTVVSIAQLGIFLMIFNSKPFENAYYDYYLGLILVILWAAFIFKMKKYPLLLLVIITWIIYIGFVLMYQDLLAYGNQSSQFATFLNNIMFLISMTSLGVLGNYLIDQYYHQLLTEKKNLEIALIKANESDQIKSNFLSTMSHEVRTPLNGIIGFSNIMVNDEHIQGEDLKVMVSAIHRQGNQLLQIIDSILKFTEIQTEKDLGTKRKVALKEIVKFVEREFEYLSIKFSKHRLKLNIDIQEKINSKLLFVYFDPFTDVLKAIVENAVKFTDTGNINISISEMNETDLILKVQDEGIGIKDDKSSEVFDDFFQIESGHNRKYEGIGMGLSYAKKIVILMNGLIWHEPNGQKGTNFYVHLPGSIRKT